MNYVKPLSAPLCWSKKFQDGDEECMQCSYKDGCRSAMLYNITQAPPPVRTYAPPIQPQTRLALPTPQATVIPPKPVQWAAPSVPTFPSSQPVPPPPKPPATTLPPTQSTSYFQQTTGASVPNSTAVPNPLTHWQRPGAVAQPYYFSQYPGESIGTRIIKNVVLRALEAIFAELMQFFRHWTWPPSKP